MVNKIQHEKLFTTHINLFIDKLQERNEGFYLKLKTS